MYQEDFSILTSGQGLTEITNEIGKIVLKSQTEKPREVTLNNRLFILIWILWQIKKGSFM